jgi:hypothetical protein
MYDICHRFNLIYLTNLTKKTLEGFGGFRIGRKVRDTVKWADEILWLDKEETILAGRGWGTKWNSMMLWNGNGCGGREGVGDNDKENLKESIPSADYVTDLSAFKILNGHVIQVQTLNGLPSVKLLSALHNITKENSRSLWVQLGHSKAWAWAEHPSTVKLVGVLQFGVSDWKPRLWHCWGRNLFGRKCQWATTLNVRLS